MKRSVLMLALVCLTAVGLLAIGCGKEEKPAKPEESQTEAAKPKPEAEAEPEAEAQPEAEAEPEAQPEAQPEAEAEPAPAAGKKYPGMWADAKVGSMVKMKMAGTNGTKTDEVVKADAETVTVRTTMTMPGVPPDAMKPTEQTFQRYSTADPVAGKTPEGTEIKKLADQTLTVADKSLKCEVYESVVTVGDKKITSRSYMCKEVPGWVVRMESDAAGKMTVMMELVDFKK